MLCNEFMDDLNRLLDERESNRDELREHTRDCHVCREAWESFERFERALAQPKFTVDKRLTDRVLQQTKRRSQAHLRRKLIVVVSFTATIAAGLLALATAFSDPDPTADHEIDVIRQRQSPPNRVVVVESATNWPQWYASTELPNVYELWSQGWPADNGDASMTESVSSGLRPVAETMSSALKVIRQNVLPTVQPPNSNDRQAGSYTRLASIA